MGSLNFGKDTPQEKFESFLRDYEEYSADDLSVDKAKRVATSGWHLIDWVFEANRSSHNFDKIGDFRESLYPNCQSLKIMHDIANADKHLLVSRQKGDINDTKKHEGVFSKEFSDEFDISMLKIEKTDGTVLSFRREIKKVKDFWESYFI